VKIATSEGRKAVTDLEEGDEALVYYEDVARHFGEAAVEEHHREVAGSSNARSRMRTAKPRAESSIVLGAGWGLFEAVTMLDLIVLMTGFRLGCNGAVDGMS